MKKDPLSGPADGQAPEIARSPLWALGFGGWVWWVETQGLAFQGPPLGSLDPSLGKRVRVGEGAGSSAQDWQHNAPWPFQIRQPHAIPNRRRI